MVDPSLTFIYARQQNEALTPRATKGTPRLSVRAMMDGAEPARANAYKVRDAMYRSELEAEMTKIKMQAFRKPGRTDCQLYLNKARSPGICAFMIATTNGEAAAPVSSRQSGDGRLHTRFASKD